MLRLERGDRVAGGCGGNKAPSVRTVWARPRFHPGKSPRALHVRPGRLARGSAPAPSSVHSGSQLLIAGVGARGHSPRAAAARCAQGAVPGNPGDRGRRAPSQARHAGRFWRAGACDPQADAAPRALRVPTAPGPGYSPAPRGRRAAPSSSSSASSAVRGPQSRRAMAPGTRWWLVAPRAAAGARAWHRRRSAPPRLPHLRAGGRAAPPSDAGAAAARRVPSSRLLPFLLRTRLSRLGCWD